MRNVFRVVGVIGLVCGGSLPARRRRRRSGHGCRFPPAISDPVEVPSGEDALQWAAKLAVACRCAQEFREIMPDPAVGD